MPQVTPEVRAIAESAFAAINSGDLDAFLALTTEDVEFTSMVAEAEGTTFHGHDGVRAWGVTHFRMAGTLSGVPVAQTMWQAVRLRDGRASWWRSFRTEREALEAAGLS
jgi:ketosteroid isomerase-like protein